MSGSYLEQSLKLLSSQQQQIREHMRGAMGADAYDSIATLTQKNLERWRIDAGRHVQGDGRQCERLIALARMRTMNLKTDEEVRDP